MVGDTGASRREVLGLVGGRQWGWQEKDSVVDMSEMVGGYEGDNGIKRMEIVGLVAGIYWSWQEGDSGVDRKDIVGMVVGRKLGQQVGYNVCFYCIHYTGFLTSGAVLKVIQNCALRSCSTNYVTAV